jgi:hypothetical protein
MTSRSFNIRNELSRSQNPLAHDGSRSHDYGSSHTVIGLEPPLSETPLHIDKLDPLPHISKGVLKCSSHNPNSRSSQNDSIFEDLGQTPCAMSALEVLQTCPT